MKYNIEICGRDREHFRVGTIGASDNWVIKHTTLKKLYKLLVEYYKQTMRQSLEHSAFVAPDLTAIAKSAREEDVVKFGVLVMNAALQGPKNATYIQRVQGLSQQAQTFIMTSIEQLMTEVMSKPAAGSAPARKDSTSDAESLSGNFTALEQEKRVLEGELKKARDEIKMTKIQFDKLVDERKELIEKVENLQTQLKKNEKSQDLSVRSDLDALKNQLDKSEMKRLESEEVIAKQTKLIEDLNKRVDELSKKAEEASTLKDQLEEHQHTLERLHKTEAALDVYKKRLGETNELKRQIKDLEQENHNLIEKNLQLEEEYRKLNNFKSVMDSYKEKLSSIEEANRDLIVKQQAFDAEKESYQTRLNALEQEKQHDIHQIQALEERIRELELGGHGGGGSLGGGLADELSGGSSAAELKLKIAKLEKENQKLRSEGASSSGSSERVLLLENLLEDANKMKAKYEQDFLQAHQKTIKLESELKQLREAGPRSGVTDDLTLQLRERITKYEQDMAAIRLQHTETQAELDRTKKELVVAQSDLSMLGSDQQELLQKAKAAQASEVQMLKAEVEQLNAKVSTLDQERAKNLEQITKLLTEKDTLQTQHLEMKDLLLQQERANASLKQTLAVLESKDGQDTDAMKQKMKEDAVKIQQLSEQVATFHAALKKAKEHILNQEAQLKELKTTPPKADFNEAVTSLQTTLRDKEAELARLKDEYQEYQILTRREQKVILSAWYDLGMQMQRRQPGAQRNASPVSWLAQQRKAVLESPFKRRG